MILPSRAEIDQSSLALRNDRESARFILVVGSTGRKLMWRSQRRRKIAMALLGMSLVAVGFIGTSVFGTRTPAGSGHLWRSAWGRLPVAARGAISAALGRDERAFRVVSGPDGLSAQNPSQALVASFGRRGVRVSSGGLELGLSLSSFGRGSQLAPVSPVLPRANANRVLYRSGSLTEWFSNGPLGLEQGFTIGRDPGRGSGPLSLALRVSGNVRGGLARTGGLLLSGPGGASLRYSGLVADDARGRALPSSMTVSDGRVLIRVDDRGATYPVAVDPFIQQAKLTDSSGVAFAALGQSSLALAGNTAVAGENAAGNPDAPGPDHVAVFVAPSGGWGAGATLAARLTAGGPNDAFGASVAISADGSTIAVGAPETQILANLTQGAVYVFQRPAGGWTGSPPFAAELDNTATGAAADELGKSVSISADGSVIAAGLPQTSASGAKGAVYVFERGVSGWTTQATPHAILTDFGGATGDRLGYSVALAGDTIIAGAPGVNTFTGDAFVFQMPTGGWVTSMFPNATLFAGGGQAGDQFGWSVAVSSAATTIAVGAPFHANSAGAVYVYPRPGTNWTSGNQAAALTTSNNGSQPSLGSSVAIDGNTIVGGAPDATLNNQPAQGAADVYAEPAAGWANATQDATLAASDGKQGDTLGTTVAIANGTVIAGAPAATIGSNAVQGALYAFGSVPVTSVVLTPASPNGRNGWYTTPVNVSVSATGLASPVVQTDCVLDPASPPASFGAIPAACPFAAAGASVSADGRHSVYAASENAAGNDESPVSASFKIDRTPPTLTCAGTPSFQLGGVGGAVSASVADATSGPSTASVSVAVGASVFGSHAASVQGFDKAGNSATISCPYSVTALALRPSPTMSWVFRPTRRFTLVLSLMVASVPAPAGIRMSCSGHGCPFRSHTSTPAMVKTCKGKGKHKKCTKHKPGTHSVNLTRLFSKRHLGGGTELTIEIVQANRVGKVFEFKIRANRQPTVSITCLAPGSDTPGRDC
jgi:hypothetical protein